MKSIMLLIAVIATMSSITIAGMTGILSISNTTATLGQPEYVTFNTSGGTPPYTWLVEVYNYTNSTGYLDLYYSPLEIFSNYSSNHSFSFTVPEKPPCTNKLTVSAFAVDSSSPRQSTGFVKGEINLVYNGSSSVSCPTTTTTTRPTTIYTTFYTTSIPVSTQPYASTSTIPVIGTPPIIITNPYNAVTNSANIVATSTIAKRNTIATPLSTISQTTSTWSTSASTTIIRNGTPVQAKQPQTRPISSVINLLNRILSLL